MTYTREASADALPLLPVLADEFDAWLDNAPQHHRRWLESSGFRARPGKWCGLPGVDGALEAIVFGMRDSGWLYQLADLPGALPGGHYRLESVWERDQRAQACIGWGLAAYRFERYREHDGPRRTLYLDADIAEIVEDLCSAQAQVRDLVNTPTEDMGPSQLADATVAVADRFGARTDIIVGENLLKDNFPAIHAVGRAADRQPRFIEMTWGDEDAPLLVLAGKGVCFDTGGLNIKSAAGMGLMKKDMGGAAHALALAGLVMKHGLPLRLMVLIPAVENAVSGNAYRPGDVINTRKCLTVEIGNTDAEGRVVLADALAYACEHQPDLVIDFATLTGAARVAMGPDVPPVFSNRRDIARALVDAGEREEDPLWELPLYQPYRKMLKSEIAHMNNVSKGSYGGCITAALFLEEFVSPEVPWVHIDTFAWNQASRPGRPTGGEAQGLRAVFSYLRKRYG